MKIYVLKAEIEDLKAERIIIPCEDEEAISFPVVRSDVYHFSLPPNNTLTRIIGGDSFTSVLLDTFQYCQKEQMDYVQYLEDKMKDFNKLQKENRALKEEIKDLKEELAWQETGYDPH